MSVAANPSFRKWVLLSAFIGLVSFAAYVYYFAGPVNVISMLSATNPYVFALAFVVIIASVALYSLAWRSLLDRLDVVISPRKAFMFFWVGIFLDILVPGGWSGDFLKAYLLSRDQKAESGRAVASIVAQKILIMLMTLGLLILGLLLLISNYTPRLETLISIGTIMGILVLSIAAVTYLSIRPRATKRILGWFTSLVTFVKRKNWNPESFQRSAEKTLNTFHNGIKILTNKPRIAVRPLTFMILAWILEISSWYLIFISVGYLVSVDKVLIVYAIIGNLQTQGVAFVGFAQIAMGALFVLLGISPQVSLTATLLVGITVFWFKLLVSFFAFQCVVSSRCISFAWAWTHRFLRKPREPIDAKQ